MKTAVILGGSSALGRFLGRSLAVNSGYKVLLVARTNSIPALETECSKLAITVVSWNEIISKPPETIDVLVNCSSAVPSDNLAPGKILEVNNRLIFHLVADLFSNCKIQKYIFISTMSVYGGAGGILDEKTPIGLESEYAISKAKSEKQYEQLCNQFDCRFFALRVPVLVCQGVKNNFLAKMRQDAEAGKPEIYYFNPRSFFNAICDARVILSFIIMVAHNKNKDVGIFNIAARNCLLIRDVIKIFSKRYIESKFVVKTSAPRGSQILSVEKIAAEDLFLPSVEETLDWWLYDRG